MNTKELADLMVERGDFPTTAEAKRNIDKVFTAISDTLSASTKKTSGGEKHLDVKIKDFGNFRVKKTKARTGRNPQTGESVKIPAKTVVRFTPLKALKVSVDPKLANK